MNDWKKMWLGIGLATMGLAAPAAAQETKKDVADRIDRAGDKYERSGDTKGVKDARDAAKSARDARSVEKARSIERDFNRGGNGDAAK